MKIAVPVMLLNAMLLLTGCSLQQNCCHQPTHYVTTPSINHRDSYALDPPPIPPFFNGQPPITDPAANHQPIVKQRDDTTEGPAVRSARNPAVLRHPNIRST